MALGTITESIPMDDFLFRAVIAGIGVALVTGPLGSFVVWRRMAFFGDTLAHSALLGIAIGLLLGLNLGAGVVIACLGVALILAGVGDRGPIAGDTVLGILSHGTLALGLVAIGFAQSQGFDLIAYLFGDILAVTKADLVWIYAGAGVALAALIAIWRPLLSITVHADLAAAEGVPVRRINMVFMLVMALAVAAAMKVVGILLVAALLIIPAAAARNFARNPEQMAILSALIGVLSVIAGLGGSLGLDTPAGPSIVVAALLAFMLSLLLPALRGISASR
ncbi:MAG: metal ABC transporter permease [Rhodospirillales bacterium]|jgi:zinc transport system permease protein|nr:metal ABC transporter permease [Rhodospirillales bacterium]MDP6644004.1 metal ABC transporter permease [Rhodospirillales bacterium]MDP6841225.1 metal ABC transporter permease [Rhodospirillales bacterium]|tara:strand:- start:167 stop:1003 length:837 start_codon:yes stop_codon:yes gene_type:complete